MAADTPVDRQPEEGVELVEAQVIASGTSYFTSEVVVGPNGKPMKTPNGEVVHSTLRHEALQHDIINISQHEFDRLAALGAVREPSDAPIGPEYPVATPFGVPLPDADGQLRAYAGPVMGDPRPQQDLTEREALRGAPAALTPEQAAELERRAREGSGDSGDSKAAVEDGDYESATKADLQAEADRRGLDVEGTGASGNVTKDDLVAALEEDDENQ